MQDSSANKLQSNTNSSGNMSRSPEGALRPTPIKIEVSFGLEEVWRLCAIYIDAHGKGMVMRAPSSKMRVSLMLS